MVPTARKSWLLTVAIVPIVLVFVVGGTNAVALDGDGVTAVEELRDGTDPFATDTDGDGLDDASERAGPTDPTVTDSDGDGLDDGRERDLGTDPTRADTDRDGLDDGRERDLGTDPTVADSDGDGLSDGEEVDAGADPLAVDTDGDGLNDAAEVQRHGTDPAAADTDDDGLEDETEIEEGTNPTVADSDGDGLPDGRELELGTHPFLPDTDGDGLLDGAEADGATRNGVALPDADPLRMDLYVQIDHAPGVDGIGPDAADRLEGYFVDMPVENPDGSTGIDLHVRRGGALDDIDTYTGDNFRELGDVSERARGDRQAVDHGILLVHFDDDVHSVGFGSAPGDFVVVDAATSPSSRESIAVHELLHNVVGELEHSSGRCDDDPAHYCDGGWLEPSLGGGFTQSLPESIADEIEESGFEG